MLKSYKSLQWVWNEKQHEDLTDHSWVVLEFLNFMCYHLDYDLVSGYYQIPRSVLPQIEHRESDEEKVCIIKNESVESVGIEEGRVNVVVSKEGIIRP